MYLVSGGYKRAELVSALITSYTEHRIYQWMFLLFICVVKFSHWFGVDLQNVCFTYNLEGLVQDYSAVELLQWSYCSFVLNHGYDMCDMWSSAHDWKLDIAFFSIRHLWQTITSFTKFLPWSPEICIGYQYLALLMLLNRIYSNHKNIHSSLSKLFYLAYTIVTLLAAGGCGCNFRLVIFKLTSSIDILSISC